MMSKKWIWFFGFLMIVCLLSLSSGCGLTPTTVTTTVTTTEPTQPHFTISWEVEGVIVETDGYVAEGEIPRYDGSVPVKTDAQYQFTFTGWTPEVAAATQDQKYVAIFEQGDLRKYRVTWKDADTTVISMTDAEYGSMPSFSLPTDTAQWNYTGWSPAPTPITGDCSYIAVRELNNYSITWIDADDALIDTTVAAYGSTPTHSLPEDTELWDYTGWSPTVVPVTGDATYRAVRDVVKYQISDEVLFDDSILNITIQEAYDDLWGFNLTIYYENKTDDVELMFVLDDAVVNGYVISTFFIDSLAAGTKAVDTIEFSEEELDQSGILSVDKVELFFRVYNNDDWSEDDFVNARFVIFPTGLTDGDVISPGRPTSASETILVDNENMEFVVLDAYADDIWGYCLDVYIENKTSETELMFSVDEVIVNGYLIVSSWAFSLPAGTKAISTVSLSSSELEDSGITSVDKIDFSMRTYDYDDWFADDLIDSRFILYPTGLSDDEVVSPDRPHGISEAIVLENDIATFIIIEPIKNNWSYMLTVFLENKTNMELRVTWDDVSVNGYAIDPYWTVTLPPDSKYITTITFDLSDFEECDIQVVAQIDFLFRIYDANDWFADDIVNITRSYQP